MVARNHESSERMGNGHDEKSVPNQTERRRGLEHLPMGKFLVEEAAAAIRDRYCGRRHVESNWMFG